MKRSVMYCGCVVGVHSGRVSQTRPLAMRIIRGASKGRTVIAKEGNIRQRILGKGSEGWCTPGIFGEQIKRADVAEAGSSL